MAQLTHRINLATAKMPLRSADLGQTVMVSNSQSNNSGEERNPAGIIYMENYMPTEHGFTTTLLFNAIDATVKNIVDVRVIFSDAGTRMYLGLTADGYYYTFLSGDTAWTYHAGSQVPASRTGKMFSVMTINGSSYIYWEGNANLYEYNEGLGYIVATAAPTGLTMANILGFTSSHGRAIAVDNAGNVAWSSASNPLDFVPSSTTGAGGGSVEDLDGDIQFITNNSTGFVIYSFANAVSGTFTGNFKYPFKLKAINGSKGGIDLDTVAYEVNASDNYVISKGGLQRVNNREAVVFLPELTDFLFGRQIESYSHISKLITVTRLTSTMYKKIKFISSRYLVISYGENAFDYALIYDLVLERFGKIKVTHYDVFEYHGDGAPQLEVAKESIGFVVALGEVRILRMAPITPNADDAVMILGKFQHDRDRHLVLQEVSVDDAEESAGGTPPYIFTAYSMNGRDITAVDEGTNRTNDGSVLKTNFRRSAINHEIIIALGKCHVKTVQLLFSLGGRR